MRPLILACVCVVVGCSTDVFETDGGSDATVDVSVDVSFDAGSDASSLDAPSNGDACPYSGDGSCGGVACSDAAVCCVSMAGAQCVAAATCFGAAFECLGPCEGANPVCCIDKSDGGALVTGCPHVAEGNVLSTCGAAGSCSQPNQFHVCVTNTDCPGGAPNCASATVQTDLAFTFGICLP